MKTRKLKSLTRSDVIFDTFITVIMLIIVLTALYPFLNSAAISFNHADDTTRGGITLFPRQFTWRNYELVFTNPRITRAYSITIARTVIGLVTGLFFTATIAYGLSNKNLVGRKFYIIFCLIPMFFGGGLIPTYFLMKELSLTNSFWVYIIPNMLNLWNMMLMRNYFQSMPEALEESARIDGANYIKILFRIILPISTPIVATISLYIIVFHWNQWFDASIYVQDQDLKPVQTILSSIIAEASFAERIAAQSGGASVDMGNIGKGKQTNVRSLTMATMMVTILPIIMVYPFIQKYFNKGIMIGSIKG